MKQKIEIEIDTDNAAFEDDPNEVCRILRTAVELVIDGYKAGYLSDANGNTVGTLSVTEEKGDSITCDELGSILTTALDTLHAEDEAK